MRTTIYLVPSRMEALSLVVPLQRCGASADVGPHPTRADGTLVIIEHAVDASAKIHAIVERHASQAVFIAAATSKNPDTASPSSRPDGHLID